jgi:hypothetical protein
MLLLSLLTQERSNTSDPTGVHPQNLGYIPGMVISWNVGNLLMEVDEANENEKVFAEGDETTGSTGIGGTRMKFKSGYVIPQDCAECRVVISDYLEVVAAAKAAVDHLSLDKRYWRHRIYCHCSALILQQTTSQSDRTRTRNDPRLLTTNLPTQLSSRGRYSQTKSRTQDQNSIRSRKDIRPQHDWRDCPCSSVLSRCIQVLYLHVDIDDGAAVYTLSIPGGPEEGFSMRRRHCPRGAWGSAGAGRSVDVDGLPVAEGDAGGWRWEWT